MEYQEFLKSKTFKSDSSGFNVDELSLNNNLFDWQRLIVKWALKKGKSALFLDTGLGKTIQQLEWASCVCRETCGKVLVLTPLAVARQTLKELRKFSIDCPANICRTQSQVCDGISIANYEMVEHFNADSFDGVVLDESSILKNYSGKTKNILCDMFSETPYKLACSATPAPNDFMELGNHSEFLGEMSRSEMLSMFFIHDGGETQKWRLKGHASDDFWKWYSSFSVMLSNPRDIGFDGSMYDLPEVDFNQHIVGVDHSSAPNGELFRLQAMTLMERRRERRMTIDRRCKLASEIANSNDRPFLAWCDLNDESALLTKSINGAVEVKGSDSIQHKESAMLGFSDGSIRCLVTKPSICGFGMNWQHCSDMAFVGLSDSYEQFYQALRRCWRFGQKNEVHAHIIVAETEGSVLENIRRKQNDAEIMRKSMLKNMIELTAENIKSTGRSKTNYNANETMKIPQWMV